MTLTKKQREVLRMMAEGWELKWGSDTPRLWDTRSTSSRRLTKRAVHRLCQAGAIEAAVSSVWDNYYRLTPTGVAEAEGRES